MKLWQGLTDGATDALMDALNSSIAFDSRLYAEDITGSLAHAAMLARQGIISPEDGEDIARGLRGILADIQSGALPIDMTAEDIHSFVEAELTRRIGDAGRRLHTGRSRNDQVATDMRLYVRRTCAELAVKLCGLMDALVTQAEKHTGSIMPGYTHLQRAQPVTLAHYLCAYAEMLRRDIGRLEDTAKRANLSPLGSGALAATTYPIDRLYAAEALGFDGICPNSMDGVADRDFCIEALAAFSLIMTHLSRFSEELILWCSAEFGFATLPEAFTTGSSIMPQKKNPDLCELVRGKTGRVYGDLFALLTVLKGLPLAYNKDMQEDKEALFDAADTVMMCAGAFAPLIAGTEFHTDKMRRAAAIGYLNATDCADYLVGKGMPFREAYGIVGRLVATCQQKGVSLEELPLPDYQAASALFDHGIYAAIALDACVERRAAVGGPSPAAVLAHMADLRTFIASKAQDKG